MVSRERYNRTIQNFRPAEWCVIASGFPTGEVDNLSHLIDDPILNDRFFIRYARLKFESLYWRDDDSDKDVVELGNGLKGYIAELKDEENSDLLLLMQKIYRSFKRAPYQVLSLRN